MAFINFRYLLSKGLNQEDYFTLIMVIQKESLLLYDRMEVLDKLAQEGLVEFKQGKPKNEGVRITKTGQNLIKRINTPLSEEKYENLSEHLCSLYESHQKTIGHKHNVEDRILWFCNETGFSSEVIYKSVEDYLDRNTEYTMSLENLIWKEKSKAFSVHKKLSESKLYEIICDNYGINKSFYTDKLKGKMLTYMFDVSKLDPPKNLPNTCYFSGSADEDKKHIENIKKLFFKETRKR